MARKYKMLSELRNDQKMHMAWRLDHYTGFGLITIGRVCRGELGDMPLDEAFRKFDMRPHQAKCHAAAVEKYDFKTYKPVKVK